MLPVPLPGERLRQDVCPHIRRGNIIDRNEAALCGFADEVVSYVDMLGSIVELGVGGKLDYSLVIGEDSLRLAPGGVDARRDFGAIRVVQWPPLLRNLVLVVRAEVRRRLQNLAGFQLPEQAAEPDNLLHSV